MDPNQTSAIKSAKFVMQAILCFFYTQGNSYIPAALKVFNAKVTPQLQFGVPVWQLAFNFEIERVQPSLLYKIFGLPHCVPPCGTMPWDWPILLKIATVGYVFQILATFVVFLIWPEMQL